MNKRLGLAIGCALCLGMAAQSGCDSKSSQRAADPSATGTPVQVKSEKLAAATAKGTALEIYQVSTSVPGEPAQRDFAVVVAGAAPGSVEILNARYAKVGGQQVDMALGSAPGDVCLIPAKNLHRTAMVQSITREALLKQAATGKVSLPEADE